MAGINGQWAGDIKEKLLEAGCTIIKDSETEQDMECLLFSPSEHRCNLLKWLISKIFEVETDNLEKTAIEIGIPNATKFVQGNLSRNEQVQNWNLVVSMIPPDPDDVSLEHLSSLNEQLAALPSTSYWATTPKLNLLPRDLINEVKRLGKSESSVPVEEVEPIKALIQQEVAQSSLPSSVAGRSHINEEKVKQVEELICQSEAFNDTYSSDFASWIRSQPVEGPNTHVGSTIRDFHHEIEAISRLVDARANVHGSMIAVHELAMNSGSIVPT